MKIVTFILPGAASKPVGGFKIVFEYANRLIKDNYQVNIVLPATLLWKERKIKEKIKGIIRYPYFKIKKSRYEPFSWFPLDKNIKILWVPTLEEKYIPNGDFIFATACETAEYVNKYRETKGEKYYLIQHFEQWYFSEERVLKTWKYDLKKIVIAKWLEKIGNQNSLKTKLIFNGLDFEKFNVDIGIRERKTNKIIMLYHTLTWKGSSIGLQALKNIKKEKKNLEIVFFGAFERPADLPDYIEYYQSPNQNILRKLYNESSIYLGTSYGEGWGLTVSEAMQCGCAVVCTDVVGYKEMAFHEETALLSPAGNSKLLEENIIKLLEDNNLRIKIAENGNKFIQKFTWEKAYNELRKYLENKSWRNIEQ